MADRWEYVGVTNFGAASVQTPKFRVSPLPNYCSLPRPFNRGFNRTMRMVWYTWVYLALKSFITVESARLCYLSSYNFLQSLSRADLVGGMGIPPPPLNLVVTTTKK